MRKIRHVRSILIGVLFGALYALIINAYDISAIMTAAFIGVMIPNIDFQFKTKMTKAKWSWLVNLFLVPFAISLIVPKNYYMTALFVGYYGHVVNDLDAKDNYSFALRRGVVGLLWIVSIITIMNLAGISFYETIGLFK